MLTPRGARWNEHGKHWKSCESPDWVGSWTHLFVKHVAVVSLCGSSPQLICLVCLSELHIYHQILLLHLSDFDVELTWPDSHDLLPPAKYENLCFKGEHTLTIYTRWHRQYNDSRSTIKLNLLIFVNVLIVLIYYYYYYTFNWLLVQNWILTGQCPS